MNVNQAFVIPITAYISIMALTQKSTGIIVVAILLALSGLIAIQVTLLGTARDMEAQTFRASVQSALSKTVHGLETAEAAKTALMLAQETDDSIGIRIFAAGFDRTPGHHPGSGLRMGDFFQDSSLPTASWEGDTIVYFLPTPQQVRIDHASPTGKSDIVLLDTCLEAGEHRIWLKVDENPHGSFLYRFITSDSGELVQKDFRIIDTDQHFQSITMDIEATRLGDSGRYAFVNEIVSRLTVSERQPISERVIPERLDSILSASLAAAGIPLDFEYGVYDQFSDDLILASDSSRRDDFTESEFRAGLFPFDFGPSQADLVVFFPDRDIFLWRQIWPIGLATILLMGVIVMVFGYTIKTIIDQRRNANLMVDFVNNMTHEFKTPISTVALASEAILRDDVINDRVRVAKFGQMIQSENRRMRLQTEKILQMAALEEKDHRLKMEPVDFHLVINEAVENVALRVESLQGRISLELTAQQSVVLADPIHLSGIINNLLDNAVKYSEKSPVINVHSLVIGRHLVVKVSDQGIGLKPDDRKRVFDKYFRVSSGNVHNVKGFGLGLSYVELMVAALGGDISVDSTPGRGATFRISLPLHSSDQAEANHAR